MKKLIGGLVVCLCLGILPANAQYIDQYVEDERMLYAHTKQVNQFFRRFNGEEDANGDRFSVNDTLYRNNYYRKNFLGHLYDKESTQIDPLLKFQFINEVSSLVEPKYLDFHGGEWVAEVQAIFLYEGVEQKCRLFLHLQEEQIGSKWVINRIIFEPYVAFFRTTENIPKDEQKFLHPLSHELDFMNLTKVFREDALLEQFAERSHHPDHLSVFIYEFRKGMISFKTIEQVKFHFFQIDGWYFELAKFNRKSLNSGWLISNLLKISEEDRKVLKSFIYQK